MKFKPIDDNTPRDRWIVLLLNGNPIPRCVVGGFFPECTLMAGGTWCHPVVPSKFSDTFIAACSPIGWMDVEFEIEPTDDGEQ